MKRLVLLLAMISVSAVGAAPSINLVNIHKDAKVNAAKCVTCHGGVLKQKSSNPKIKASHPRHLGSRLLKLRCVDCHVSVDLREGSAAKLRKQVNPEFCNSCHGSWSGKMQDTFKSMDCVACHADWKKRMAKATYVNVEKVKAKDCLGCHGGRALYSGAKKEKGD